MRGRLAVIHEWTKKWRSRLSEDEVAEFLTKTARKKCKNTQSMSLVDNTLLDLHNPLPPTQPHLIIAKYVTTEHSKIALVCRFSLALARNHKTNNRKTGENWGEEGRPFLFPFPAPLTFRLPFTFASSLVSESLEQASGAAIREDNKYNMLSIREKIRSEVNNMLIIILIFREELI